MNRAQEQDLRKYIEDNIAKRELEIHEWCALLDEMEKNISSTDHSMFNEWYTMGYEDAMSDLKE